MPVVEALAVWDGLGLSLFLGGGISGCPDWQSELIEKLSGIRSTLLNPRRCNFPMDDPSASEEQIRWEHYHLNVTDAVVFWFPCETLCPITLFELGSFARTDIPLFVGVHPSYKRRIDVEVQMSLYRPDVKVVTNLMELAAQIRAWEQKAITDLKERKRQRFVKTYPIIAPEVHRSNSAHDLSSEPGRSGSGAEHHGRGWLRGLSGFFKRWF